MLSNGCQGDINNVDTSRRKAPTAPYHHTARVANVCAGEAFRVWNTLWPEDYTADLTVDGALEERTMTPRRPTAEQLEAAREYLAAHGPADNLLAYSYANEHLAMAASWPAERVFPIQALRVGPLGFVGLPAEPFVEIGLEIRRRSPFGLTIPIGAWRNDCAGTSRRTGTSIWEATRPPLPPRLRPDGHRPDWIETALRLLHGLSPAG